MRGDKEEGLKRLKDNNRNPGLKDEEENRDEKN